MPFDSRNYRRKLGFTNQTTLKKHFKATDIVSINWDKIEKCNQRLKEIFQEMHQYYERGYTPKVKKSKACNSCSLKEICLPKLEKTISVSDYIAQALKEDEQ